MKRIIFIVAILLVNSIKVAAEITIPREFDGLVLGKCTREEVNDNLTSRGFVYSAEETDTFSLSISEVSVCTDYFYGEYEHEGMPFSAISTRYINDTLTAVYFVSSLDTVSKNHAKLFLDTMHSKYSSLTCADSSIYVLSMTKDFEGFKTWAREDHQSIVLTMHNNSMCICAYIAADKMFDYLLAKALHEFRQSLSSNFAEENKVYGVGGVKFGDSKASVKSVMYSKSKKMIDEDIHSVLFTDVKIGGVVYDFAIYYFSADQLVSVRLQDAFYSWQKEEALMQLESVKSQYGRKYTNMTLLKDDDELKAYNCGAYIDGYDYLPILITFQKSLSRGGDIMYYVQVDYYIHRTDNLYDDEI